MNPGSTPQRESTRRHRRRALIVGILSVVTVVIVAATLFAGDIALLSRYCGSCHQVAPAVATWQASPHSKVGCYGCHDARGTLPERVAGRISRLNRETFAHVFGGSTDGAAGNGAAVPDSVCKKCHGTVRRVTPRSGVTIDHGAHADRNGSCVSCHLYTAHGSPSERTPVAAMGLCFDCHGTFKYQLAPRRCSACHPKGFDLEPASHKPESWHERHGKAAKADRPQCEMCHLGILCKDCHGLPMPHPADWEAGESGHSTLKKGQGSICVKCHAAEPEPCSTCHHKGHNPRQGPWATNHKIVVRKNGPAACMDCHASEFCHRCHDKDVATGS